MGGFFDIESGVMGTLGKAVDVVFLSLIFLVFSLPIVTMGASLTALYYTSVKAIRRGRSYIFKCFWKSFKENFGKATIFWLAFLVLGGILCLNIWYVSSMGGTVGFVLLGIYCMMIIILLLIILYIFPVLSRFEMTKKDTVKNSLLMAIRHLPYSILMLVILAAIIILMVILVPAVFFVPACGALVYSLPMEKILKKYTKSSDDEYVDEWYME